MNDKESRLRAYRVMATIRQCEDKVLSMLMSGNLAIAFYASRGQEAIAAGVGLALRSDDWVVTTYRGVHDQLAKGVSLRSLWAEYLGRATGACGGRGGSMHITDPEAGVAVTTGIVGSGLPIANGLALAALLRCEDRVTVCNFGDGASNIGAFHEALNMAALWKLPVVFVCQNNGYAEHTNVHDHQRVARISERAASYGMMGVTVDGTDPIAVYRASEEAVARARRGEGPTLLEAVAYRMSGHYLGDTQDYIPQEWLAEAAAADPVPAFRARLLADGNATEGELEVIDKEIAVEIDDAVDFALKSPFPDAAELCHHVYAEEKSA